MLPMKYWDIYDDNEVRQMLISTHFSKHTKHKQTFLMLVWEHKLLSLHMEALCSESISLNPLVTMYLYLEWWH